MNKDELEVLEKNTLTPVVVLGESNDETLVWSAAKGRYLGVIVSGAIPMLRFMSDAEAVDWWIDRIDPSASTTEVGNKFAEMIFRAEQGK